MSPDSNLAEAIVLAIVQGLTEFLPISSTGHLSLARWLFGWDDPGLDFDVAVHLGTLGAILFAFRREIVGVLRGLRTPVAPMVDDLHPRRLVWLGLIATVPIVIVGALLYEQLGNDLRGPTTAGVFLLVTAALIGGSEFISRRLARQRELSSLRDRDALIIGLAQCLAILPGISRSGVCIAAGMSLGLGRTAATRWAFWLSIPALAGAGVLAIRAVLTESEPVHEPTLVLAAAISFVTGLVAIRALLWLVRGRSLVPFAVYCGVAGVAVLVARAVGL